MRFTPFIIAALVGSSAAASSASCGGTGAFKAPGVAKPTGGLGRAQKSGGVALPSGILGEKGAKATKAAKVAREVEFSGAFPSGSKLPGAGGEHKSGAGRPSGSRPSGGAKKSGVKLGGPIPTGALPAQEFGALGRFNAEAVTIPIPALTFLPSGARPTLLAASKLPGRPAPSGSKPFGGKPSGLMPPGRPAPTGAPFGFEGAPPTTFQIATRTASKE